MPSLITLDNLSLNPIEATELSEAVMEQIFVQGNLAQMFDISTGIQFKKQIPFISNADESGKTSADCTPPTAGGVTVTQKLWEPVMIEARFEHCQKDLNALFKLGQRVAKINPDFFDKIDSDVFRVLAAKLLDSLTRSVFRIAWFADTAAALTSGGGVFLIGTDLELFDQLDGLWKQIFAEVTGDSRITITENAEATFALQDSELTPDDAKEYLELMWDAADPRLKADPEVRFYVTESIYEKYSKWLRNKAADGGGLTEATVNGVQNVAFNGKPVMPMYEWDRYIRTYQQNGTKYNLPHRALLTIPQNLALGTTSTEDLENLESFYDKVTKTNYLDYAYTLDAKFLEAYLAVVAY
jgi:hypothetical protein